jgi:hypothetical protein
VQLSRRPEGLDGLIWIDVNSETKPLGDARGDWYYCFKHQKVEIRDECRRRDRMGPYPTAEDAANWRQRVAARNEAWEEDE